MAFIHMLLFLLASAAPYISYFRDGDGSTSFLVAISILYLLSAAVYLLRRKISDKYRSSVVISYVVLLVAASIIGGLTHGVIWGASFIFFPVCSLLFMFKLRQLKEGWDNMV